MQISNLKMSFGTQVLFEDASINVPDNEKIGVVGVNGAGKTTLFKLIAGSEQPDSGTITLKKGMRVGWLQQVITDDLESADINVLDYLIQGRPIEELNKKLQELYDELEKPECNQKCIFSRINSLQEQLIYWDQYNAESTLLKIIDSMGIGEDILKRTVKELSGGQKSKVAFARLLYSKPEVILLDEPTNHLDERTREYVIEFLRKYKGTVFVVSHDVDFLDRVTTKTLFIDKRTKRMELFDGNYTKFKHVQSQREEDLEKQVQIQQREEDKLVAIVNKYATASGKKKKMAQDREKKLERLRQNKISPLQDDKAINFKIVINREGSKQPLKIKGLRFRYDKKSPRFIINGLDFELYRGERFLIVGENGAGKSTLLKLIMGLLKPDEGYIKLGERTDLGYYAQEQENIDNSRTILDNLLGLGYSIRQLRSILSKFLFYGEDVHKAVSVLSPGEKCRLALAKLSLSGANMLLLDEPTNHLDPNTQRVISEVFRSYEGTMIVVSHNPEFVDNLRIERLLILPEGRISQYDRSVVEHYQKLNKKIGSK